MVDFDLEFLASIAAVIDERMNEIQKEIDPTDPEWDLEQKYDHLDYAAGLGFVACQQYLTAVCGGRFKQPRMSTFEDSRPWCDLWSTCLDLGPVHRSGVTFARAVNAAANFWKHSPAWGDLEQLDPNDRRVLGTLATIDKLGATTPRREYVPSAALFQLLQPLPACFERLIPFLEEWRDAVHSESNTV